MHINDFYSEEKPAILWFRLGLQLSLIACAVFMLVSRPYLLKAVRANELEPALLLLGPALFFILFVAILAIDFFSKKIRAITVSDYIHVAFGLLVIALLFPSSLREYRSHKLSDPLSFTLIEKFSKNNDAGIRALAILASSRHKIDDEAVGALIHQALLDKDPLVQQAAKLVIEDSFGIRLKNGAEGIHQAQSLIKDGASSALLIRKGSP